MHPSKRGATFEDAENCTKSSKLRSILKSRIRQRAITSEGYRYFLCETGLDARIRELLCDLDTSDLENLRQRGGQIRHAILSTELPGALEAEILEAYDRLGGATQHLLDVAVRSSATAGDLPDASFAEPSRCVWCYVYDR